MQFVMAKKYKKAADVFSSFPAVPLEQIDTSRIISRKDLALYVILLSLAELNRTEIKSRVLKNPMVKQIMEAYPDAANIFEDYLNGKFERFQAQMKDIE